MTISKNGEGATVCIVPGCDRKRKGRGLCDMHYLRWRRHGDPNKTWQPTPPAVRFWKFVDRGSDDECWIWKGSTNAGGYGTFSVNRRDTKAHRFSYELANGAIPDGLFVLHDCDNPPCVNPSHLHVGTAQDNTREMVERGRSVKLPLSETDIEHIRQLREQGWTMTSIGKRFGISRRSVSRAIRGTR